MTDPTELPDRVLLFGVRWRRRKGKPLQIVNHVEAVGVVNIIATQQAIAKQCKVPMSWVEYSVYERAKDK